MPTASTDRQIRVFVSSTFRDMHAERDLLVKRIFPQLRRLCEERAVTWTEVDFRWGITEEAKAEGKVLPLCLAEVERCRPYFIGLLGERYGWSLKPGDVSEALMQAEPWLHEHLEKSVTELEIYHAVLRDPAMADRALFYFRDPTYLNRLPADANPADFISESPADQAKLTNLKNVIRKEHAGGKLRFEPRENYSNPEELGEQVLADFTAVIGTLFPKPTVPDLLAQETMRHDAYARSRRLGFVGRESLLRRLDEQLALPGKPLVLTGDAGCGKSALLAEWVYRHREMHPDDLVIQHFIGSTPDGATWQGVVRRILGELKRGFSLQDEIPVQTDQLRHALQGWAEKCAESGRRVILVLDALNQLPGDDAAQQLGWLPASFPPNFCVLLSSLESECFGVLRKRGCEIKNIPLFQREEIILAVTTFLDLYGARQLPRETLAKIENTKAALNPLYLRAVLDELRQFGRHEELVATANRYLSASDLPQLFDRILDRWHADFGKETEYPDIVRRSLCLIACARFGMAETEVLDLLGKNGERLPRRPWTPFFFAAENALTQRLGLITLGHDYFRDAVKSRWLNDAKIVRDFRQQLIGYFNQQVEWTSRKVDELPWQLAQNQEWDELENALVSEECFNGLQARNSFELLGYWRMMPTDFDLERSYTVAYSRWKRSYTEPILIAELAFRVGMLFRTAGLLEVAEQKHRQALNLVESALGENHPTVGMYLSNLATICVEKSRFQEANDLFNRALAILRNQHGSDSPIVAQAMNNYSCLFMAADQLGDAEEMARQSLTVAEKTLPPNSPGMATRLNNLAKILEGSDRFEEAEPLMRRALEIEEAANGSNHPEVATRLNNLGVLLNHMAKHGEAEDLLRRALSIDERVCGSEHPAVAKSLNNLASVLSATNRTPEAMDCLNRALRIEEKASGPNDPAVATTLNNLACLLQNTNHLAEAEPLFRRALEIDKLHFGSVHSKVAQHLNNLATLLKDMKRLGEAEVAIREALSIYEQRFGPNHTTVAVALTNLGQVLHDLNRLTEAEPIMRRALDISERSFDPNHPQVALCLNNLAQLLQDTDRCAESEPMMHRALAIQRQCFGDDHPSVGMSLNNVAGLLRRTGKAKEAEPFYQKAIEIFLRFSTANKTNHPFLQNAVDNYTDLLADMGHNPKEIELRLNMITLPLGAYIRFRPNQ